MTINFSKTTAAGIFSLLTTIGLALLASGSPLIGAKATMFITLALAVTRAIVGWATKDAETVTSGDVAVANAKAGK